MAPKPEVIGPDHPISRISNALSDQAFILAGQFGVSRWDLCVAMSNACGQILADAATPNAEPPPGVTMPKRGSGLPREKALDRMDQLRVVMQGAYDLRTVQGES